MFHQYTKNEKDTIQEKRSKIPEETYYITTNFNSDNDYQKFLNTIKERSVHNFSTNLTTEDKILTLSTCYSDTERTVVHAKLIKRSPK